MSELNNALVSIVLPVYNGEMYVALSIESCLKQTHENIELIIVNDCSTDATLSILKQYAQKDSRIKIINNAENKKLPASLNIGHQEAKGDFITWTSHDNFYELNALETMLNEIEEKKAAIVYSNFFLIDNNGHKIREVKLLGIENLIFGNFVSCCFLYKKEVFTRNKAYDENLFLAEDYDFWLRALLHSRYSQIEKALYYYRKHPDSLTNQIAVNKERKALWEKGISAMYADFCKEVLVTDSEEISSFLVKCLSNQKINFEWLINIYPKIENFKEILKRNQNFLNGKLIDKVFLKKTIELMVLDKGLKSNFSKSLFILKRYPFVVDKNALKTLIKYSFFK
ncbi:glycosyltransferase family 2 protein [Flavobacterium sp. MR2016-29]|uniref:glycosyltransferase family 2 protein n=1 Tax=Flavobacterium sp. MR2016-29 TaxID=2783795 RepID=UPI00188D2A09|nr:glycosyltransferase family 2 protein [Flavobacterium sp. MR2016-29]MBF4492879.1 glycosyltransferase family 2 protein [Flavobacterium sp. MR2016-29]